MRNSKLCQHLGLLDRGELKDFRNFLLSPYFNKHEEVVRLFDVLYEGILRFKKRDLSEEEGFQRVFPGQVLDRNRFRKLKSRLMTLLLEFLAVEDLRHAPVRKGKAQLRELHRRGAADFFGSRYEAVRASLDRERLEDENHLEQRLEVEAIRVGHRVEHGMRSKDNNFDRLFTTLESIAAYRQMRYGYIFLNQYQIVGGLEESRRELVAEEFRRRAEQGGGEMPSGVQIYFRLGMTLLAPEERSHFEALMALLETDAEKFLPAEQKDMFTGALNHCIRRVNAGDKDFRLPLFQLYQRMLAMKLLQDRSGMLSPFHFKNIVSLGTRLEAFDWVEKFIDGHGEKIRSEHRTEILAFNRGVLEFHKSEFESAEGHFNRAVAVAWDVFYSIDIRFYLLRIYFETGNEIGMESLTHAFRIYLHRHKSIDEARRKRYLNFIKWFRRLYQLPLFAREKTLQLKAEVEAAPNDAGVEWLLGKLERRLNRKGREIPGP